MKSFREYLAEAEKKTKTKTKPDVDWSFEPPADQPLANREPERADEPANEPDTPKIKKASQADTLRATSNMQPTDQMRNMLSRMRDIETDDEDDGYPDPEQETLPSTEVNTANLPAIAGRALPAAGEVDPEFHKVANLPGNMARAIRTLGKSLFRSFTRTETNDIYMIGSLGGQGPNSAQEVNGVANWVRENGEELSTGDIDFDTSIPGYRADIKQYSAAGIRWLLVRDEFGNYIYSWPENDSIQQANTPELGNSRPRLAGR